MAPVYSSLPRPVRLRSTVPVGQVVTTVIAFDGDGTTPNNQVFRETYNKLLMEFNRVLFYIR